MKRLITMSAVAAATLLGSACGGSSGNTNVSLVQLVGTVTTGTTVGPAMKASVAALASTANQVWAMPVAEMQGANIDRLNLLLRQAAILDGSGNFTFNLKKTITIEDVVAVMPSAAGQFPAGTVFNVNWLLVLVDNTTTPPTPVSVVELQGDIAGEGLVAIPLSAFSKNNLDLGTIDAQTGASTTTVSGLAADLSLSSSHLSSLVRTNRILKKIMDIIRNCDLATGDCYEARQSYVFMGNYDNLIDLANYDTAGSYSGYQLYFDVTDYFDKTDFDGICPGTGSATVQYHLTPPGPVEVLGITYDLANPFDSGAEAGELKEINDGAYTQCFKNPLPLYVRRDNAATSQDWSLQFITGDEADQVTDDTPLGFWTLSRKSSGETDYTNLAQFEFAIGNPVDSEGHPVVFVPAVRFDTDGLTPTGLTTLNVKWYQYIGAGYVEITDTTLLTSLLGSFQISLDDMDGIIGATDRRSAQQNGIPFSTSSIDVSDLDSKGKFLYDYSLEDQYNLDYFGISYGFAGQSFRFAWRPVHP